MAWPQHRFKAEIKRLNRSAWQNLSHAKDSDRKTLKEQATPAAKVSCEKIGENSEAQAQGLNKRNSSDQSEKFQVKHNGLLGDFLLKPLYGINFPQPQNSGQAHEGI